MSPYHCISQQITSVFVATVQPCLVLTHLPVPVPSLFLLQHTNKHTCRRQSHMDFRVENKLLHILLPAQSYLKGLVGSLGHTQLLCHCRAEEGSYLEEQWRRSMGRAGGAPGARNVNWEDCFNKALIFADAGRGLRGLAGGATQMGGQLTVRYCQQT